MDKYQGANDFWKIHYYTTDHGGMRDELLRIEEYCGCLDEVEAHVRTVDTGWGFKFTPGTEERHGTAIIKRTTKEILDLEFEIRVKQNTLKNLNKELTNR